MGEKARPFWLLLAVVGLALAAIATASALLGEDDTGAAPTADESAVGMAVDSTAVTESRAPAGTATDTPDPTPTPPLTPASDWPTLDLPTTHPAVVVERFLSAVFAADCDRALRQVTTTFEKREGDCALFARDTDGWEYTLGETEVDADAPIATVPATLTLAGQDERYRWQLVIVKGTWKINDVEQ